MEEEKEFCSQKLDNLNLSDRCESDDSYSNQTDHVNSESEFIDLHSDTSSQHDEKLSTPVEETSDVGHQSTKCEHSGDFTNGVSHPGTEGTDKFKLYGSDDTFPKSPYGRSTQCTDSVETQSDSSDEEYHSADDGDKNSSHLEDGDDDLKCKEKEIIDDEEYRKNIEESLSDDEKLERKDRAQELKNNGNKLFREGNFKEAVDCYCQALDICPLSFPKERAIMFSNRAACRLKEENFDSAISDCTKAIELHPQYLKALLRRAELYDKKEKLDEALADFTKVVELDPSQHAARASCLKLAEQIKDRNEKMKAEMLGKLKDLGNMILRPFGMSTENFQMQQDPNSGSYSVQYKPN